MPHLAIDQEILTKVLARVAHAHDNGTLQHATRMAQLGRLLAQSQNLSAGEIEIVSLGAQLHDVGKNAVPDAILMKPGRLDETERSIVARHTISGYELLRGFRHHSIDMAAEVALHHHECFDGSGYPAGLAGQTIPSHARIVAVADVYDALRAERPYKAGLSHVATMAIITKGDSRTSPQQFDPAVLHALQQQERAIQAVYAEPSGAGVNL
jgi:HD-GYP domain-containing protein (c-di-GMP phosphodiesterase class II)